MSTSIALNTINENFTVTRELQNAADFGKKYFDNGYSIQIVYKVYQDDKLIKTLKSTDLESNLFVLVCIGKKAVNGVAVYPVQEMIYDIKFSKSNNTKKCYCDRVIIMQSTL